MPETPIWHIPYPSDSDPADVPADMEELADALESALNSVQALGVPVGSPIPWLVSGIPSGFREFDGSAIVAATHPVLYALFGGTIPDLRGRVMLGQGGALGAAVGGTGGQKEVTVSPEQMPVHSHVVGAHRHIVDTHGHGGGDHGHVVYDPNHQHIVGANSIQRHEGQGSAFNLISGLAQGGGGNAAVYAQGSVSLVGVYASGVIISNEAPGTSYEAPGTTTAGGLGGPPVTQPLATMPPYRAVRWITRAA